MGFLTGVWGDSKVSSSSVKVHPSTGDYSGKLERSRRKRRRKRERERRREKRALFRLHCFKCPIVRFPSTGRETYPQEF